MAMTFEVKRAARARSFALVLGGHGVAIWLVLAVAHTSFVRERETIVGTFDIRPIEAPPPFDPPTLAVVAPGLQGAAAPARPAPRQTPPAALLPAATVELPTAPTMPAPGGPQTRPDGAGGGGTGGTGSGLGSAGNGTAGLRPVISPRLRAGEIVPRDYPRSAGGAQGNVVAHVAVGADGRVTGCTVARSSGNAILDATTCRLIHERFRFTPARNARGEAVTGEFGWQQRWWRD